MQNDFIHLVLSDEPDGKDIWRHGSASEFRMNCEFGRGEPAGSNVDAWNLGRLDMLDARFAHLSLSPLADGGEPWLFLKLVLQGAMNIEQGADVRRIGPGEIVLVESTRPYSQSFDEPTDLVALRFPARALKERGLRHALRGLVVPDMSAADVRSIGELVVSIARQHGETSVGLRRRQGEQLLDVIDLLIDDPVALTRSRSGDATLFRAKRYIAQNLRNPDLTIALIASAVCISDAHLGRLFRADGLSVMRYVWDSRLALAADMLKRSDKGRVQISDIAYRCGFSTPAHFSRVFRERYGVAPREALATDACEAAIWFGAAGARMEPH
ncbi:helix-turn-helix domain-containing protein [Paraburkholderia solisilvae]|uniref:HTH-type transcriptional activator RhaS n=1 Tax=Paraburkholderia solisilvae TaxID=624376 RepID=A0A6J5DHS8_9BURK|nr:helix-turn-helix domain-containing protein [Paraburkholderia solisilvae]CAB3752732.1 HTH-type transcriptional activator RhaS [Paraburkholderia solisilvae]